MKKAISAGYLILLQILRDSKIWQGVIVTAFAVLSGCTTESQLPVMVISCPDAVRQIDQDCSFECGEEIAQNAEVRIRGNSSLKYPKKSMRLELDSAVSFCQLPAHHVWVLNANYIDKSFIRHRLSFDLFRAMDAHNLAPNGCYRELEVNGDYRGLYFVHERIDQKRCGIMDQQPGGAIYKEPPVFVEGSADFEPGEHPWGQKYPDADESDMSELAMNLKEFIHQSKDSAFAADVASWFHLENVADWMLLLMLTNNTDGIYRNFYLYRLHEGMPFRIAIWDYDETFGRFGDNRLNNVNKEVNFKDHPLLGRLLRLDSFRDLLRNRWQQHRKQDFSEESISDRISAYETELASAVASNFNRWPADGPGYIDDSGFRKEVRFVREFIQGRLVTMDRRLAEY